MLVKLNGDIRRLMSMKVWRLHLRTSFLDYGHSQEELFEFCFKEGIIGVGWAQITNQIEAGENIESSIRNQAYEGYKDKPTPGIKAINAMNSMQVGDLIWTRCNGDYYLCKVNGRWIEQPYLEKYIDYDITNYVPVTWLKIGMEDRVPGKVVSSFRPASAVQKIGEVEDISAVIWNNYRECNDYSVNKSGLDIWTVLHDKSIEELVILYLQVEKGYFVYSSTLKPVTRTYECRMVNLDGEYAFPQVKSGSVSLNANDYMQALTNNKNAKVYLFAASENYTKNEDKRFVYLTRRELEDFIKNHKQIVHPLVRDWMKMCGFFD